MAAGVDELEFLQDAPLVTRKKRLFTFLPDALPPPGSLGAYAEFAGLKTRRKRVFSPLPSPTFFGPPFVPSENLYVTPTTAQRGRQKTRFNYFPEYPVPTLYRPCELEVLQVPNNPYARLHRHRIKAIIYMRTTYKGDPTC